MRNDAHLKKRASTTFLPENYPPSCPNGDLLIMEK